MGKKIIRVILFPAILCLLLVPASLLVLPKNNTAEAGTLHPDADGILSQRRDSIDVLFLGDSLAYCGFMPLELWDTYGIPGFVCSSLAEKTFETQELLEQALGCQSPKVVVLDVNVLYWTCKKEAAAFYKLYSSSDPGAENATARHSSLGCTLSLSGLHATIDG